MVQPNVTLEPGPVAPRRPMTATTHVRRPLAWRDIVRSRVTGLVLIVALLLVWEASATWGWVASDNWPRFSAVLAAAWRGWASGEFVGVVGSTLYRTLVGFAIGSLVGSILGVVLGRTAWLDAFLKPLIEIVRTLPSPALIPPLILLLGVDDALKIVVIVLSVFPPVFVNAYAGVKGTDETLVLTARTFGLSRLATMWKIVLPASAPAIAAGMRTALALALVVAVIGEMISGSNGVGFYLTSMQYAMRADAMYAAVLCVAVAGYLLNRIFLRIERSVLHWQRASRR